VVVVGFEAEVEGVELADESGDGVEVLGSGTLVVAGSAAGVPESEHPAATIAPTTTTIHHFMAQG
jgi:hypothetical protein